MSQWQENDNHHRQQWTEEYDTTRKKLLDEKVMCDEPKAPPIIYAGNSYVNSNKAVGDFLKCSGIQSEAFSYVEKYGKRNNGICARAIPPSSTVFIGAKLRQKQETHHGGQIHIGGNNVEISHICVSIYQILFVSKLLLFGSLVCRRDRFCYWIKSLSC